MTANKSSKTWRSSDIWERQLQIKLLHKEIELNSGDACYSSVKNLLSSHLFSNNVNIKIYKSIILPLVLYGSHMKGRT